MKISKEKIIIISAILLLAAAAYFGYYRCPFKLITGIPCPSCGMTRAFRSVIRGDLATAFSYHPLWPLTALAIISIILKELKIIRPSEKIINIAAAFFIAALMICYIIRLINHTAV